MGLGHHHPHLNFHFHLHQRSKDIPIPIPIPKGCVAILVGEEQHRFVIPVVYVNHPLFVQLLKDAEEDHGFHHDGPISIPCPLHDFRSLHAIIHHDTSIHHHLPLSCFRPSSNSN